MKPQLFNLTSGQRGPDDCQRPVNATPQSSSDYVCMGKEKGADAQLHVAGAPTHRICARCNGVIAGEPLTVGRAGAVVNAEGICAACETASALVKYGPEFQTVFLNGAAIRHLELAKQLRAIGQPALAEHEEATARRMQNEINALPPH